ncbi:unnamed protein product, partial [Heterosigma akashiwo]
TPADRLRSILRNRGDRSPAILLPGIHDALSAKVFSSQGADVLFLSGFGVSAARLAVPDFGLLTQNEMEDCLRAVVQTVGDVPVIVDGDTGYGGAVNIRRTVRSFAAAGASAITIEDQVFPKKCTYAAGEGVRVVSREESLSRIKAALKARDEVHDKDCRDIVIVARTDCRAALGFEEALLRCKMYEDAGAEIVYAENLQSREEYEQLRSELRPSTGTILAQLQTGRQDQTLWTTDEVGKMNYDLALFGVTALQAYVQNLQDCANALLMSKSGNQNSTGLVDTSKFHSCEGTVGLSSFENLKEIIGFADYENFF